MKNYVEWRNESGERMIQVFNEEDLPNVQRHYIERGCYIKETIRGFGNSYFFTVYSANQGEQR